MTAGRCSAATPSLARSFCTQPRPRRASGTERLSQASRKGRRTSSQPATAAPGSAPGGSDRSLMIACSAASLSSGCCGPVSHPAKPSPRRASAESARRSASSSASVPTGPPPPSIAPALEPTEGGREDSGRGTPGRGSTARGARRGCGQGRGRSGRACDMIHAASHRVALARSMVPRYDIRPCIRNGCALASLAERSRVARSRLLAADEAGIGTPLERTDAGPSEQPSLPRCPSGRAPDELDDDI